MMIRMGFLVVLLLALLCIATAFKPAPQHEEVVEAAPAFAISYKGHPQPLLTAVPNQAHYFLFAKGKVPHVFDMEFNVIGAGGAHIAFMCDKKDRNNVAIEIALGINGNTLSEIRDGTQGAVRQSFKGALLHAGKMRAFWISYDDGYVKVWHNNDLDRDEDERTPTFSVQMPPLPCKDYYVGLAALDSAVSFTHVELKDDPEYDDATHRASQLRKARRALATKMIKEHKLAVKALAMKKKLEAEREQLEESSAVKTRLVVQFAKQAQAARKRAVTYQRKLKAVKARAAEHEEETEERLQELEREGRARAQVLRARLEAARARVRASQQKLAATRARLHDKQEEIEAEAKRHRSAARHAERKAEQALEEQEEECQALRRRLIKKILIQHNLLAQHAEEEDEMARREAALKRAHAAKAAAIQLAEEEADERVRREKLRLAGVLRRAKEKAEEEAEEAIEKEHVKRRAAERAAARAIARATKERAAAKERAEEAAEAAEAALRRKQDEARRAEIKLQSRMAAVVAKQHKAQLEAELRFATTEAERRAAAKKLMDQEVADALARAEQNADPKGYAAKLAAKRQATYAAKVAAKRQAAQARTALVQAEAAAKTRAEEEEEEEEARAKARAQAKKQLEKQKLISKQKALQKAEEAEEAEEERKAAEARKVKLAAKKARALQEKRAEEARELKEKQEQEQEEAKKARHDAKVNEKLTALKAAYAKKMAKRQTEQEDLDANEADRKAKCRAGVALAEKEYTRAVVLKTEAAASNNPIKLSQAAQDVKQAETKLRRAEQCEDNKPTLAPAPPAPSEEDADAAVRGVPTAAPTPVPQGDKPVWRPKKDEARKDVVKSWAIARDANARLVKAEKRIKKESAIRDKCQAEAARFTAQYVDFDAQELRGVVISEAQRQAVKTQMENALTCQAKARAAVREAKFEIVEAHKAQEFSRAMAEDSAGEEMAAAVNAYRYGCYKDDPKQHVFPHYAGKVGTNPFAFVGDKHPHMTACAAAARKQGHTLFALQNHDQCWTGPQNTNYGRLGEAAETKCRARGAVNVNQVYGFNKPTGYRTVALPDYTPNGYNIDLSARAEA